METIDEDALLALVDGFHAPGDLGVESGLPRHVRHGSNILGEARAAVSAARVDELIADPGIRSDALAHGFDIGANTVREAGELVHQTDPRCQHDVGGVLGQFRGPNIHVQEFVVIAIEWRIESFQQPGRVLVVAADDHAVGFHEVRDRRAFLEKFGVRDHGKVNVDAAIVQFGLDGLSHRFGGSHGNGGFARHHGGTLQVFADGFGDRPHVLQVHGSVIARGCPDGHEYDVGVDDAPSRVRRKGQSARRGVLGHQGGQSGLEDRQVPFVERRDLLCVDVDADDLVAHLRETGTGHQAHVAGTEDRDIHGRRISQSSVAWSGRCP